MLLRRWAEQQQQKPWYWWWWQGLCTAQCLLTQLNECTNKMAKATLVSPFFDLYNNAWVNAISCIQLAGQSTTLHGKHFNVGHYTKTVKSNVCRLAMSTGAIDIRHFIPLPVSWDLLQDHVEFLSSEKQERAFLFWFVWYSQYNICLLNFEVWGECGCVYFFLQGHSIGMYMPCDPLNDQQIWLSQALSASFVVDQMFPFRVCLHVVLTWVYKVYLHLKWQWRLEWAVV